MKEIALFNLIPTYIQVAAGKKMTPNIGLNFELWDNYEEIPLKHENYFNQLSQSDFNVKNNYSQCCTPNFKAYSVIDFTQWPPAVRCFKPQMVKNNGNQTASDPQWVVNSGCMAKLTEKSGT